MTAPENLPVLLELAERAARQAGTLIIDAHRQFGDHVLREEAQSKSSRTDLVTEIDRQSERAIIECVLAGRPNDAVLGEEEGHREGTSGITWVIDPLDGTTNFVYGYPLFAVSIVATYGQESIVGAVYDPMRNEMFTATKNGGAHLDGVPLSPKPRDVRLGEALIGTGFRYQSEHRKEQAMLLPFVLPAVRDIRRGGSAALDLCYVAAGRLDGYYEAGLQSWDRAAGELIAKECGLSCADVLDLVPSAPTLVVAKPSIFSTLCDLLSKAAGGGT